MPTRRLMFIDMAYTYAVVKAKGHEQFLNARHSGGYFDFVCGVHPLADVTGKKSRDIEIIDFTPRQLLVEGVAFAKPWPRFLNPLNFIVSQAILVRLLARMIRRNRYHWFFALIHSTADF